MLWDSVTMSPNLFPLFSFTWEYGIRIASQILFDASCSKTFFRKFGVFLMSAFSVYLLSRKWVNLYIVCLFHSVIEITLALNVHITLKWTWSTNRQCEKLPAALIIEWINIDIKHYCHFVITPSFHSTPLGLINYA